MTYTWMIQSNRIVSGEGVLLSSAVVARHARTAVRRVREAVRFVMERNHSITAVVFALVTAVVVTVVVHSGCRDLCRLRLHRHGDEPQHVQQVGSFHVTDQFVNLQSGLPVVWLGLFQRLGEIVYDVLCGPQIAHRELIDLLDEINLVVHHDFVGRDATLEFEGNGSGGLQGVLLM